MTPTLRLTPSPAELHVAPGTVVQQVRIDPAMCENALKYAIPAMAEVTTAEGRFSVQLERCRIPLADPGSGALAGTLVVHSAEIGPGPLIRELATVLGRAAPARLAKESSIPFELRDRRIWHSNMEMVFSEMTVRTSGSVGLDQTVSLMAEIPVPSQWLGTGPLASAVRGQTIPIPIGGTLQRPGLDRQRLDEASRRFIGNATRNLIEGGLRKPLEQLLNPQR